MNELDGFEQRGGWIQLSLEMNELMQARVLMIETDLTNNLVI